MEWIPIAERLPEVKTCGEPGCEWCATGQCSDSVLVMYPAGFIDGGSRFQVSSTAYLSGPYGPGAATHWMPIPPAPKE